MIIHLGCTLPYTSCDQPGQRRGEPQPARSKERTCCPYSVLLPVGFAVPFPLPVTRCALTAPFHPCPAPFPGAAVYFLWHFPWSRLRRTLSGTVSPWSPDFPHKAANSTRNRWPCAIIQPTGVMSGFYHNRSRCALFTYRLGKPVSGSEMVNRVKKCRQSEPTTVRSG